jgi:hypothetical protein
MRVRAQALWPRSSVFFGLPHGFWQEVRMTPGTTHSALTELQLARLVEVGDPASRDEVKRRYARLARQVARKVCGQIAHRGGRCPGRSGSPQDCDRAYIWIELDLLDRFAGRAAGGDCRARKALIVTWLQQPNRPATFTAYVWGRNGKGLPGIVTEARRTWNRHRQLKVRLHLPADLVQHAPARYGELIAAGRPRAAADVLGLSAPTAIGRWLQALFDDACETGLQEPIDVARVTRHLLGAPGTDFAAEEAVALLGPLVDAMLCRHWPHWWDEYLGRPRQHTRAWAPLLPDWEEWPWVA